VDDEAGLRDAAKAVHALGPAWVLVTGGHLEGGPTDLLYDGQEAVLLEGLRVHTAHTHGTGCVLASALAAYLALGADVPTAARDAKAFVTEAIRRGYPLGAGPGPVRPS
ncbi:MAG: bifunctional hydroxymethylpyrimidine kinase/phosphomethylpyrimidine kinase, partial [Mycobacteriales bacterium]